MDLWDRDAIDFVGPAIIEITADGRGSLRFIAVDGSSTLGTSTSMVARVEFSWDGNDEGTTCQTEGGPAWTRMARCVATSSSTLVTTLASAPTPLTCPNNAASNAECPRRPNAGSPTQPF